MFRYVDRTYVLHNDKKSIFSRGLMVLYDAIVNNPAVRPRLCRLLQLRVLQERRGEVVDRLVGRWFGFFVGVRATSSLVVGLE